MDAPTVAAGAAIIAVTLTAFNMAFGGGWRLKREMSDMKDEINASAQRSNKEINEFVQQSKREIELKVEEERKVFGDTLLAHREKMNLMENYTAQTYVRRDDFQEFRNDLREDLKSNFTEIKDSIRDLSKYIKNGHS